MNIQLIFAVIALVCFLAAAIGVSSRIHLGWLGMACLALMLVLT